MKGKTKRGDVDEWPGRWTSNPEALKSCPDRLLELFSVAPGTTPLPHLQPVIGKAVGSLFLTISMPENG